MPERIRLSRAKGWRKPAGCIVVSRPSRWGNPWPVERVRAALVGALDWGYSGSSPLWDAAHLPMKAGGSVFDLLIDPDLDSFARVISIALFRSLAEEFRAHDPEGFARWIAPLRGKDLGCWCSLDDRCHADVLLELANGRGEQR